MNENFQNNNWNSGMPNSGIPPYQQNPNQGFSPYQQQPMPPNGRNPIDPAEKARRNRKFRKVSSTIGLIAMIFYTIAQETIYMFPYISKVSNDDPEFDFLMPPLLLINAFIAVFIVNSFLYSHFEAYRDFYVNLCISHKSVPIISLILLIFSDLTISGEGIMMFIIVVIQGLFDRYTGGISIVNGFGFVSMTILFIYIIMLIVTQCKIIGATKKLNNQPMNPYSNNFR